MYNFRIVEKSLQILETLLIKAVNQGTLNLSFSRDEILSKVTGLDEKYLSICLQYLLGSSLLSNLNGNKDGYTVHITAKAVDLIESQDK